MTMNFNCYKYSLLRQKQMVENEKVERSRIYRRLLQVNLSRFGDLV